MSSLRTFLKPNAPSADCPSPRPAASSNFFFFGMLDALFSPAVLVLWHGDLAHIQAQQHTISTSTPNPYSLPFNTTVILHPDSPPSRQASLLFRMVSPRVCAWPVETNQQLADLVPTQTCRPVHLQVSFCWCYTTVNAPLHLEVSRSASSASSRKRTVDPAQLGSIVGQFQCFFFLVPSRLDIQNKTNKNPLPG